MKKVMYLTCIITAALILLSSKNTENPKYIYLNAQELKPLGIELSEKGLFYQNCNPEDKEFPYLYFYSIGEEHYVVSGMANSCTFNEEELMDGVESFFSDKNDVHRIFKNKDITEYDFYPMFVGNPKNKYTFLHEKNMKKLVPIAIDMSETKINNRTDTVIFWFYPTESLKKSLPDGVKIEDYLRLPDAEY